MPRNGSGVYGPPAGTTATPNTPIESAKFNAYVADAAEALTNSVNVSGTAPYQANQPMGGFKFTGIGDGSAASDSASLKQVQGGIVAHASAVGGTADVITATFAPAFAAWTAKMRFRFTSEAANATTTPTVNVDGLGAKTIKKLNSIALGIGDIHGSGHICDCVYDGTDVILLNPALVLDIGANTFTAKQTFNGPVVHGTTVLADAATIAWDLSTGGPNYKVTITSNRTLGAFSGATAGQEGFLTVAQDGAGGWSLDLSAAVYDFFGGFIENVARGANDETVYHYRVISAASMILMRLGATSISGSRQNLLDVQTASASANINFILTKWLQLYDRFEIDFDDVLPAMNNVEFWFRMSTDGGATYDAGTGNYMWCQTRVWLSGSDTQADGNATKIILVLTDNSLSNVAGETLCGNITISNPRAAQRCKISFQLSNITDDTARIMQHVTGAGARLAAADVDAIRFLCSSGNIASGTFRLYGIRK